MHANGGYGHSVAGERAPTPAVAALIRGGIDHRLHRYNHDPGSGPFGAEAAKAMMSVVGADAARVHKTLVVDADGRLAVVVVPVTTELDLRAAAAALGARRAALAPPAVAQRVTGYVVGGISPLGQKRRLPTLIDAEAQSWPTIFVSGGQRGLEIELAAGDLAQCTTGQFVPLARKPH